MCDRSVCSCVGTLQIAWQAAWPYVLGRPWQVLVIVYWCPACHSSLLSSLSLVKGWHDMFFFPPVSLKATHRDWLPTTQIHTFLQDRLSFKFLPRHVKGVIAVRGWCLMKIHQSTSCHAVSNEMPTRVLGVTASVWYLTCWWSPMRMRCWHAWLSVVMVWASRTSAASSTITRRGCTSCRILRYLAAPVVVMPITWWAVHHSLFSGFLWLILCPKYH